MNKKKIAQIKKDLKNEYNQLNDEINFLEYVNDKSYDIIKKSELFDEEYYKHHYPDVQLNNFDPIEHYLTFGTEENCNPNNQFNTQEYLTTYNDVKKTNINPFVHYILYGIFENRYSNNIKFNILKEKYKVSIIMPSFNRKKIIEKAINSCLNQTFDNFEIIIIDDGSTDNTKEYLLSKYKTEFTNQTIKYYSIAHKGVSFARNIGLKYSTGNLIAYLDTDNLWHPMFLETMITELNNNKNYNCAYCAVKIYNSVVNKDYVLNHSYDRKELIKENFIDLNSFIHEKSLYEKFGGFDEELTRLVDWDLIIKYTKNNDPLFIDKELVTYFISNELDNITNTKPLNENRNKIKEKTWKEKYYEEYNIIKNKFDSKYYLEEYGNELESTIDPIYHFLEIGHKELKNPNEKFITSVYLNKNPDIARSNMNPFVHYVKYGEKEGREINNDQEYDEILNNNLIYLSNYTFKEEPLVSIIILNRNGLNHLKTLFKDFSKKTNYQNFEIIVVDNASTDKSVEFLEKEVDLPIKIIKNKENVSFAKGNNDAVKISKGEYILLLNNDIEPTYGWLNELMGTIIYEKNVGAVGAKLLYPFIEDKNLQKFSFTVQHSGDIFREFKNPNCLYIPHNQSKRSPHIFDSKISTNRHCSLVTGAVLLTKKDIYNKVGGLDEKYWYGYEDVDYNLKLNKYGYKVIFASAALLFHHESATRKTVCVDNHKHLCEKWGDFLFKKILEDKINNYGFYTDQKLKITFISKPNFNNNEKTRKSINNLVKKFNTNGYNTNILFNINQKEIEPDVDILISYISEYDIKNIDARKNIIKILILNEKEEINKNYDEWSIIITENKTIHSKFEKKYANTKIYHVQDVTKLDKEIIQILEKNYLI